MNIKASEQRVDNIEKIFEVYFSDNEQKIFKIK